MSNLHQPVVLAVLAEDLHPFTPRTADVRLAWSRRPVTPTPAPSRRVPATQDTDQRDAA